MVYKTVFFGYIAAAIAVVAALVLIFIMLHQDRQYERKKLLSLAGMLVGSISMNTMYFLSYFDSLANLGTLYRPVERTLDILTSFVINLFLFLFLYYAAGTDEDSRPQVIGEGARLKDSGEDPARTGAAARLFRPALVVLIAGFLFAGIVYVFVVTDEYHASSGHLLLAETGQLVLTAVICLVTGVYAWMAARASVKGLRHLIAALGAVNILTAIYNAAGSVALFHGWFDYEDWGGVRDFNTWLFILSDILILLITAWYFRIQTEAGLAARSGLQPEHAGLQTSGSLDALGLTPREREIAGFILQRQTYREIAEQLTISEHTVKRHVHNIYEKAGVSRRDEFIRKMREEKP